MPDRPSEITITAANNGFNVLLTWSAIDIGYSTDGWPDSLHNNGAGVYPGATDCTAKTILKWANEMSRHIKSIDKNHLVSVGDEGFYCDAPDSTDGTMN